MGARLCDLLEGAIRSQCRIKAGLSRNSAAPATSLPAEEAPVSGRSQAYEILKRSKVLEKQIREQLASLHTMRLPRKAKECMEGILELVRLQQQVQSKTLLDLGMIKKRIKGYDGSMFDSLVREHQLIGRLLANMVDETEPPSAGI